MTTSSRRPLQGIAAQGIAAQGIAAQGLAAPPGVVAKPRDTVRDILKDGIRRFAAELSGVALLVVAALTAVALLSWSVRDPSLNHAVDGPVRNWLGSGGAIVADVLIQLFGVAVLALVAPVARWGQLLLMRRRLSDVAARTAAWVLGVFAAAAFASLLPRTDSWPLPAGLGGAVGDGIERLPLVLLGSSAAAKALAAAMFGLLGIIALNASMSRNRSRSDTEELEDARSARQPATDDDEPRNDEPSRAIVLIGALIHGSGVAIRGVAGAVRRFRQGVGAEVASKARAMVDNATRDSEPRFAAAAGPQGGALRREPSFAPRETAPRLPSSDDAMTPISAPVYHRRAELASPQAPAAPPPASPPAPAPAAAAPAAPTMGYGAAVAALRDAARRRLGLSAPEPKSMPEPQPADLRSAGERAAISALQEAARRRLAGQRAEPALDAPQPQAAHRELPPFDDIPAEVASFERPEPPRPQPQAYERQASRVQAPSAAVKPGKREIREAQPDMLGRDAYELPPLSLLNEPKRTNVVTVSEDALEQNARLLEGVLDDFGVKGEIINVRPGPVVTLYELEPAPGTKSSRVIGLADDIARSMSAISARVAVVPGRNAIGIELPNQRRETVYFRELIGSQDFEKSPHKLALSLGKTIGGEAVIAELAKMPHLLVAGTTGSGKSVAMNTMILSLLYKLRPDQCRLIMIDPKMLELSIYEGIPHLLTPVVTDPKKAVVALKWAVREMEDRYKKMSKIGVRNIDGFNARVAEARATGEVITRTVQTGFDKETGEGIYEQEEMSLEQLPYIVVLIDEMADLMMVAGKDIEGAVQRLAQMARAAGIHVIMATQRPSVDVITGTIKANFPTRISFQVTSKIDSRTILGEMGAEQLLGQGDMLHMAGGGRISRVHGPFVSDEEVERVVNHLKRQGKPQYLDAITREEDEGGEEGDDGAVFDKSEMGEEGGDLYEQACRVVLRDRKASTSYIQRRLQIGYNRAASLMERMENEGIVGAANHAGKREILVEGEE
jgi:DNA segregation ATPase FtsK/SpoIIIE, S-DNA-T family